MGAKYLPTVRDQKASLRFQQIQQRKLQAKKAAVAAVAAVKPPPKK
jgi:hypothetical protein